MWKISPRRIDCRKCCKLSLTHDRRHFITHWASTFVYNTMAVTVRLRSTEVRTPRVQLVVDLLYNKKCITKSTTNLQQIESCTTSLQQIHNIRTCWDVVQQIEQLYNKPATLYKILQLVQQIYNKSTTNRTSAVHGLETCSTLSSYI